MIPQPASIRDRNAPVEVSRTREKRPSTQNVQRLTYFKSLALGMVIYRNLADFSSYNSSAEICTTDQKTSDVTELQHQARQGLALRQP